MSGSDFLQLDSSAAPSGKLAAWLAGELRAAISDGRLSVGDRLPSGRELAADLRVSRGVVNEAYQRLVDDGRIAGRRGAGTVVVSMARATAGTSLWTGVTGSRPASGRSAMAATVADSASTARRLHPDDAVEIDLSPGLPDLGAFPRAAWLRSERGVLDRLTTRQLGYPSSQGALELREAVASWLGRTRGITTSAAGVIIVAGVAQGLALVAGSLTAQGIRSIAVEDPGSLGAREELRFWGLETPPIRVDADGLVVADLVAADARAVLVTPAHEFPFGVVLAPERRRQLRDWALAGGLVVEDDYDAEHRYDRPPVPAVAGLCPEQVVYTGSVSKSLAPAMRIGWLVPPPDRLDELIERKRHSDLGNPMLPQLALASMMTSGALERHLRAVRRRHRERRDVMAGELARLVPQARIHGIAAGLHLTITLPDGTDDLAIAAAALRIGVRVHPLPWHRQVPGAPGLVLGYAANRPEAIRQAIERLAALI